MKHKQKQITPKDIIVILNDALAKDRDAIRALMNHLTPCNDALAKRLDIVKNAASWRKRRPNNHNLPEDATHAVHLMDLFNGLLGSKDGVITPLQPLTCSSCGRYEHGSVGDTCLLCGQGKVCNGEITFFEHLHRRDFRAFQKIVTDDVVALFNEAFALDPVAISTLVNYRVPCNDALANHQTIQCGTAENWRKRRPNTHGLPDDAQGSVVGLLGLLNGIFGKPEGGPITATYDFICDACGATNVPELERKLVGDPCPLCPSGVIRIGPMVGFINLWKGEKP